MPHSTTVQVQTEFIMWISEDLDNTKSSFLFVSRFKKISEDGRKRNQEFGAEFERTRQLFNRKLVSTVRRMYGSKGFLKFTMETNVPMATNLSMATKGSMATKVQMATKAPMQCSDNKSSNGNRNVSVATKVQFATKKFKTFNVNVIWACFTSIRFQVNISQSIFNLVTSWISIG